MTVSAESIYDSSDPTEIFELYAAERWSAPLPIISAAACLAITAYIEEHELQNISGLLATQGTWQAYHGDILKTVSRPAIQGRDDWIAGPYLLEGIYYPNGISIWAPVTEKQPNSAVVNT